MWGLFYLLHHDACVVRVLSITLRYSSPDDPGPHWTPLSYTFAIFGNKCSIIRPCPLLSSRCPFSLPSSGGGFYLNSFVSSEFALSVICPVTLRGWLCPSERDGSGPKPWTRLRSESHWSNPVVLLVGQPGAPSTSLPAWFVSWWTGIGDSAACLLCR